MSVMMGNFPRYLADSNRYTRIREKRRRERDSPNSIPQTNQKQSTENSTHNNIERSFSPVGDPGSIVITILF